MSIPWRPIAELPDALVGSGSEPRPDLLVWIWGAAHTATAERATDGSVAWWIDGEQYVRGEHPSHFVEIDPPA